jgi:hypothetical protein
VKYIYRSKYILYIYRVKGGHLNERGGDGAETRGEESEGREE